MTASPLDAFVQSAQRDVIAGFQEFLERQGIKTKVFDEAQELAKVAAGHIGDETQPDVDPFPSIPIENEEQLLQYQVALEFLQSAGFKFAPSVLQFESQHPDLALDRRALGKKLNLCTYDRTPYLVQLIEAQLKSGE
jgi:hypothetical protein